MQEGAWTLDEAYAYATENAPLGLTAEDGEPIYTCPFVSCHKTFSKRFNLKAHLRVHTGDKPFACSVPGCSRRFMWKSSLTSHEVGHSRRATEADRRLSAPLASPISLAKERRPHRTQSAHAHHPRTPPTHLPSPSRFLSSQHEVSAEHGPYAIRNQQPLPSIFERPHSPFEKNAPPPIQNPHSAKREPAFQQSPNPPSCGRDEELERRYYASSVRNGAMNQHANPSHRHLVHQNSDVPQFQATNGIGVLAEPRTGMPYLGRGVKGELKHGPPVPQHPPIENSQRHVLSPSPLWREQVSEKRENLPSLEHVGAQGERMQYTSSAQSMEFGNRRLGTLREGYPSSLSEYNHASTGQASHVQAVDTHWPRKGSSPPAPELPSMATLSRNAGCCAVSPSHPMTDIVRDQDVHRQDAQRPARSPSYPLVSPKPIHVVMSPAKPALHAASTTVWGSAWGDRGGMETTQHTGLGTKSGPDMLPSMSGSGASTSPHAGSVGSSLGSPGIVSSPVPPPMLPLVEAAVAPRRPRPGPRGGSALLPPLPNVTPAAPPQHIDLRGLMDDDAAVPLPSLGSASTSPVVAFSPGSGNQGGFRFSPMPISPLQPFSAGPGHGENVVHDSHYTGQAYSARTKQHGAW